mgnify:CR=1 FL=1
MRDSIVLTYSDLKKKVRLTHLKNKKNHKSAKQKTLEKKTWNLPKQHQKIDAKNILRRKKDP